MRISEEVTATIQGSPGRETGDHQLSGEGKLFSTRPVAARRARIATHAPVARFRR